MKRVAYVSTLAFHPESPNYSTELLHILNAARTFNKEHEITGVLMIHGANVLQLLEGPPAAVAQLLYRISRDKRHDDISIILNCNDLPRLFGSWSMRLVSLGSPHHRAVTEKLLENCGRDWVFSNTNDKTRLDDVLGNKLANNASERLQSQKQNAQTLDFQHKNIRLLRWPKPSQIKMSRNLTNLCSLLSRKPTAYESVIAMHLYKTENELIEDLTRLSNAQLISCSDMTVENGETKPRSSDRFSRVLQRFISTVRKEA